MMKNIAYILGFLLIISCLKVKGQIITVTPQDSIVIKRNTKSKVAPKKNNSVSSADRKKPIIKKGNLTYVYDPKLNKYVLMNKQVSSK